MTRSRRRFLLPAVVLGLTAVALPTIASSATPSISAYNEPGLYGRHYWMPSTATVGAGGVVKFDNSYTETHHGLKFTSGGVNASEICTGLPTAATTEAGEVNWHAECTFSKAGTYAFVCTVHPEMKGTITVPGTPTATTEQPTEVTQTTATLRGAVEPEGNATEYRFEYGTTTVSEHATSTLSVGSEDFNSHVVSAAVTGLAPGVKYRVQLVAVYGASNTTVLGGEQTFTAPAPGAPTVKVGGVTGLTETEATLNGTVDPNGGEATEYLFEYGPTPAYGQTTALTSLPPDNANHQVSATLTKLTPGTLYYFKLAANNKPGGNGAEGTFTTASPSPAPEPTPTTPTPTPTVPQSSAPPPTPPTSTESPSGSPLAGGPSLRSAQHGSSVAGSLDVSPAGAGGRLEVDLLATRASLAAARRSPAVRVGRLLRSSVSAGPVAFKVKLDAQALHALRRLRHLAVTVRITLTPPHGPAVTVTRTVQLRR